jgi:hypothetical protein
LNQGTKLPGTGGLSGQEGRKVRTGHTDSPARSCGQPGQKPRTVHKRQQNHQRRTKKNGLSARTGRTVRTGSEPSATKARTVRKLAAKKNLKQNRIENEDEQEHDEHAKN